mgnify:CR=1 FL=1
MTEVINYQSILHQIQEENDENRKYSTCKDIAYKEIDIQNEDAIKAKEQAILILGSFFAKNKMAEECYKSVRQKLVNLLEP